MSPNNTDKKVVLITSNQYKPNIGGIENSLFHLAQEYKELGYKPILVVSDLNPEQQALPAESNENGVAIFRYAAFQGEGMVGFIRHVQSAYKLYRKVNKQYDIKFTVCRYHFNLVLLKIAGLRNVNYLVPGVVKNESKASPIENPRFLSQVKSHLSFNFHKLLQWIAFATADKVSVFSQNMFEQVRDVHLPKNGIFICKPGVSLSRFEQISFEEKIKLRGKLGLAANKKAFLCIGRFVKAKGFETAINAFSKVEDDNSELWLLGEGPLGEKLKERVLELNLSNRVRFLGKQSCPELYYKAADFFVMSSTYEPLGQTILEALACGLPIIAASASSEVVTASSEILEETRNLFVAKHDADEFARAFERCLTMSEEDYAIISAENRVLAESKFSWVKLAQDLELT
ncbi:glycosyltransferase family 4 protein [Pseudoalteromonas fenneropenaei]|uniref:Glycosyltransferase family 4 protein n=1 Tax=Pseudoalteromonas fenneropenaei TaxID=1737459 RepID=A0ABV7CKC4_9GAMM